MVEVKDLSGWSRLPASLQCQCLAAIQSTLDQREDPFASVEEVTYTVSDAGELRASMVVRITPVLNNVVMNFEVCHE